MQKTWGKPMVSEKHWSEKPMLIAMKKKKGGFKVYTGTDRWDSILGAGATGKKEGYWKGKYFF